MFNYSEAITPQFSAAWNLSAFFKREFCFPRISMFCRDEDVPLKSVDCICFLETRIYHGDILA